MDKKNDILQAWIMTEWLSEGAISKKRTRALRAKNDSFYEYVKDAVDKANENEKSDDTRGAILYIGVVEFKKLFNMLRKKYGIEDAQEEMAANKDFRFGVELRFDKDMRLLADKTFVTVNTFAVENSCLPNREGEFREYQEKKKKDVNDIFQYLNDVADPYAYKKCFDYAIGNLLNKWGVKVEDCWIKIVAKNIDTTDMECHSFFVLDLERAKTYKSQNLDRYLSGADINDRINLNSGQENCGETNYDAFTEIMKPEKYQLGRFPSAIGRKLSFMQQAAVNIGTGMDDLPVKVQSVNGPPGTGKTTLLKEIFAELIVRQAYEIAQGKVKGKKMVLDDSEWYYGDSGQIYMLPRSITDNGIVVASSNNAAVQNIVNDMPKMDGIDEVFCDSIDYFKSAAEKLRVKKWEDKNGKDRREPDDSDDENKDNQVINDGPLWGLFSIEGGKKANLKDMDLALQYIDEELKSESFHANKSIYDEFTRKYNEVKNARQKIQTYFDILSNMEQAQKDQKKLASEKADIDDRIAQVKRETRNLDETMNAIPKPLGFIEWLSWLPIRSWMDYRKKYNLYAGERNAYENKLSLLNERKHEIESDAVKFDKTIKECTAALAGYAGMKIDRLNLDCEDLQMQNFWFDDGYRKQQSELFILALKVRKQFLYENERNVHAAQVIWNLSVGNKEDQCPGDFSRAMNIAWGWINFAIPVIGTTFASVKNMFSKMDKRADGNIIGHLFIDEAGQATPQASVGAIMRSKYVMAVGDPSQIEPIYGVDSKFLKKIRDKYDVSERFLSTSTSTQTLMDNASKYGFYKDTDKSEWIGIPLWVHRRCQDAMFEIANHVSYGGNMVQGTAKSENEKDGAKWVDVPGQPIGDSKYVREQCEKVREILNELVDENIDVENDVYVITPFRDVVSGLKSDLGGVKGKNIGTIHTFQGKEAPIVILVLGAGEKKKGAAWWAMGSDHPNIMNVAATRAKKRLYIVGDKKFYKSLHSDVIDITCDVIDRYAKGGED